MGIRERIRSVRLLLVALWGMYFPSCGVPAGLNLFPVEEDVRLGAQFDAALRRSPEYAIWEPRTAEERALLAYVQGIVDTLLRHNSVPHEEVFRYRVSLVRGETVNAFATAGGYLYVYTGLLKQVESEAELAGILGHEVAHAAHRHVTRQLTARYGLSWVSQILLGQDPGLLEQLLASLGTGLAALRFSRDFELEADRSATRWLLASPYRADAILNFLRRIQHQPRPPEFLSTHPDPARRIREIERLLAAPGSAPRGDDFRERYQAFKERLLRLGL
ncbi:MAG: M48 family metalloprotease [Bacteroidetes bacterium]|nr:M48 family metalloprotease [Rhodothermia bacterium]MCS7154256.1 M48 family metalloprotease [Bacteroidota bacterium]MCX7906708.1 M48 family metalloprotease [Bacteroidota bacterium]MDW8137012.1 M48 family metalloprotease [Bacteroidota bacterium]MDW8285117.1 M48 family metalloprotease [Bacteroidota bacterium]